ncbi:DotU family type IV/VI secretion system protein, partial [Vibrio sp. 03_296]|uniref:DotU family type IV/VI secretion system protein n=1 Tax=Vibrio sp. 03_296 TaxID=2024409 RepID=UPI002D7F35E4
KMRDYENRLRLQGANSKQIDIARYCLCCAIDEAGPEYRMGKSIRLGTQLVIVDILFQYSRR